MSTSVVVLAAGKGTRMKTDRPKSLHAVAGRTLLGWALNIAAALDPDETSIVVGHDAEAVTASCPPGASVVIQEPQLGTGHAVQIGLSGLTNTDTTIVVIPGDMPLITSSSITRPTRFFARFTARLTIVVGKPLRTVDFGILPIAAPW